MSAPTYRRGSMAHLKADFGWHAVAAYLLGGAVMGFAVGSVLVWAITQLVR